MRSTLRRRLARLEVIPRLTACALCGRGGGGADQADDASSYRVSFADDPPTTTGPDHCPSCGALRIVRISFESLAREREGV